MILKAIPAEIDLVNLKGMEQTLRRPHQDRRVAGVCAGIARHWNIDALKVRLVVGALGVAGLFSVGISTGLIVALYLVAWFLIPSDSPQG